MIRAAAALPVEIYLLFDFNMFQLSYLCCDGKEMMKVDPLERRELSGTANNLQSTSIYIKLQKPAQCCSASLSCCNLHS